MTNKMTYSQALEIAINAVSDEMAVERLKALQAQLAKRNATPHKPTKTQVANEGLKNEIYAYLEREGAQRAKDVGASFEISGQKASALLKQMVDAGTIEKVTDKRVSLFRVAQGV